ncbi:MAG: CHAP domain-containing protein [Clostridia bacterium]|nr:CHAP domain-containing protein [Clostridia bacterium]
MKMLTKGFIILLVITTLWTPALAAKSKATPTPAPVEISQEVQIPPEEVQAYLDIAYNEWETLAGKTLKKVNKYTEWRGKGIGFGWCGGFATWCMMQADIPMDVLEKVKKIEEPVEGIYHVKEASVGKLLRGYQEINRSTRVPQPGYLLIYGVRQSANKTVHVGMVYDVEALGNGKYRLTTIEGNMSNRVKMYVHDYDMYAKDWTKNLSAIPKEERTREENSYFNYKMQSDKWYVNCFLMPWIPEDEVGEILVLETTPAP